MDAAHVPATLCVVCYLQTNLRLSLSVLLRASAPILCLTDVTKTLPILAMFFFLCVLFALIMLLILQRENVFHVFLTMFFNSDDK